MSKKHSKASQKRYKRPPKPDKIYTQTLKKDKKSQNTFGSYQSNLMALLFFGAIAFIIYINALDVPFIFDDSVVRNQPALQITQLSLGNIKKAALETYHGNRPVANITFGLNYYFDQYDVWGYHLVNILIHIATTVFLYLFIKGTLKTPALKESKYHSLIPFTAAAVWMVNPVHTQSVTFIYQRMNSLMAMFYMLTLVLYIAARFTQRGPKRYILTSGCILAGLLALGSKENAGTLPFVILLYEWFFFRNLTFKWSRRQAFVWGGLALCLIILIWMYIGTDPWYRLSKSFDKRDFTMLQRVLTEFRVVIYYISLLLFPHPSRLNLDYDFPFSVSILEPFTTIPSIVAVLSCIAAAIYLAPKARLVSFCILWFFGNLVIESSVVGLEIIYEHRTYLPSMMLILMLVVLAFQYVKPNWFKMAVFGIIIAVCSFWTVSRNQVWRDPVVFWRDCVRKSPNKARPHSNLGFALMQQGRTVEARRQFSKALELKPDYPSAHVNMGTLLERQGDLKKAIWHYQQALKIKPDHENANYNLGVVLHRRGDTEQAYIHYTRALAENPDNARAHNNIGVILQKRGEFKKARNHYLRALRINPDYTDARRNLDLISSKIGLSVND